MEAVSEAENVTLVFMNQFGCVILRNAHKKSKRGLPFRIWGHRTHLGDGGRFGGWKYNSGI